MAREGTRSQTGHSTPRIFQQVDTAPAVVRKKSTKPKAKKAAAPAKGSKPTGVTKKPSAPKKPSTATKAKAAAKKVEKKVAGETKKKETKAKAPKAKAEKK